MWGLCVGRPEVGGGVEPEAVEAEGTYTFPRLSFAIGGLDVSLGTRYLGRHVPGSCR